MKKLAKVLLATGIFFAGTGTTSAAEIETPDYLVKGVVKDVTQKILPISIEGRFFAPHMDLKVKSDRIYYNGGSVGLKDDLGFGNDNAPELIFRYKNFTADYFTIHGTGSKNFTRGNPLYFNGGRFFGDVNSDSDFHYLKLQVTNPIVKFLGSGVDWNYGLTGIYWKGSINGRDANSGNSISESKSFGAPIPTIGVGAHASLLDTLLFNVQLSGLPLGGYGHIYDFEAGLRYNPIDLLSISLGYRKIHANIKHKDDSGTLDMHGPYAGLRFDF